MERRLVAVTAAVVGTAVLLAGCGGGGGGTLSKSQYEQKLRDEGKALQAAFTGVGASSGSLKQLATNVGKAQVAANKAADDLDHITPPKDAQADNKKLAAALRVIGDEMGKLQKAAKDGDQAAAARVQAELTASPALKEAQAAAADLKHKGYQIGVLGQ